MNSNLFARGEIIRQPAGSGPGYWVGAPGVFHSTAERAWYLTYRVRRPRGVEPDRGGEAPIARSTDLKNWQDVWSVTKDKFDSASIERCCLYRGTDRLWRYFVSYVDPTDGRWCVSVLKAREVGGLSPQQTEPLFKARSLGLEGIKDPWIVQHGGTFYMFLSIALPTSRTTAESHNTLDIFNTGECVSATGLATSPDLAQWQWQGVVFKPAASGWDSYCRRINSVLPHQGRFVGFYDGSASHAENYEEKTGLAFSTNLRDWHTLTPGGPLLTSPHGFGSLRYLDAQLADGLLQVFYEFARPDGAHELRLLTAQPDFADELVRAAPGS
jgi:hypothetical protein